MRKKVLLVIAVLFGLMMINSGLNKFFNYMPMPEDLPADMMLAFAAFMQLVWLMPLIAVVEIIGGVLFMIPKFRALGAIMLLPIVVGILLFHIVQAPQGLILALVLLAINAWAILEDWNKYLPLIKKS